MSCLTLFLHSSYTPQQVSSLPGESKYTKTKNQNRGIGQLTIAEIHHAQPTTRSPSNMH